MFPWTSRIEDSQARVGEHKIDLRDAKYDRLVRRNPDPDGPNVLHGMMHDVKWQFEQAWKGPLGARYIKLTYATAAANAINLYNRGFKEAAPVSLKPGRWARASWSVSRRAGSAQNATRRRSVHSAARITVAACGNGDAEIIGKPIDKNSVHFTTAERVSVRVPAVWTQEFQFTVLKATRKDLLAALGIKDFSGNGVLLKAVYPEGESEYFALVVDGNEEAFKHESLEFYLRKNDEFKPFLTEGMSREFLSRMADPSPEMIIGWHNMACQLIDKVEIIKLQDLSVEEVAEHIRGAAELKVAAMQDEEEPGELDLSEDEAADQLSILFRVKPAQDRLDCALESLIATVEWAKTADSLGRSTVNLRVYFWLNGREHSWLKVRSSVIR